ncbi:hypothetical protein C2S52_014258 [Perilla frutescens var. hirtella]|nr:hypothetical protein C2S52_014258 [Perilla frutescens var. hirtella]
MGQDFFTHLPPEIIEDILVRLPIRSIIRCKCVLKSWLNLLATPEFAKFHLSRSAVPGLAVFEWKAQPKRYKIIEFVDELDPNCDEHGLNVVFSFDLPSLVPVHNAANGLLFLWDTGYLIICNPITRDYIEVPLPLDTCDVFVEGYGFGVSGISGQYKLVRMSQQQDAFYSACEVYTVGTGSWRRIASSGQFEYEDSSVGAFLNGNLYWFAYDFKSSTEWISCFDLETELISTFPPPPIDHPHECGNLSVLGDCLCLCYNWEDEFTSEYDIVIWLMKDYGDEKSWTREFVFRKMIDTDVLGYICPIKVFEDGDILMEVGSLLYYCNKTDPIREVDVSRLGRKVPSKAAIYAPSLVSLKTFPMENVTSF